MKSSTNKLIVFSGVCGSGKTTEARGLKKIMSWAHYASYDELKRAHPEFSDAQITEHLIRQVGKHLWEDDVIVDACNLHAHDFVRWQAVAWAFNVQFIWKPMATDLEECIQRDRRRSDPVGAKFIRHQAETAEAAFKEIRGLYRGSWF